MNARPATGQAGMPILPERSGVEKILEVVAVAGVLFCVVATAYFWPALPPNIPSHFGISGRPDAWGGKGLLLVFPILSVSLYAVLTVLSFFPHKFSYPWGITEQNASRQYQLARSQLAWIKAEMAVINSYIQWTMMAVAWGKREGLGVWFLPVVVMVLGGTVGFHQVQAYRARR